MKNSGVRIYMLRGRRRRPKVGVGEWRRRRREAAPVVVGVLVEAGKPTGGASTGWRWSMLVERLEVLGLGWLDCLVACDLLRLRDRAAGGLFILLLLREMLLEAWGSG